MPIEYEIYTEQKLVFAKGIGVVTESDVLKHLNELSADKNYLAPMKKLIDYRSIESIDISAGGAYKIADKKQAYSNIFKGEKCAIVVPAALTFGTSRVHQMLVENADLNTEVFHLLGDALNWLDVTPDVLKNG